MTGNQRGRRTGEGVSRPLPIVAQVVMVVGSASLALVVLVGVGFGATTRCTNTAPVDSTSCDAIDRWAWAGFIVTVLISAAVAVFVDRQYATSVWFLSLAVILTVASIAMLSITP